MATYTLSTYNKETNEYYPIDWSIIPYCDFLNPDNLSSIVAFTTCFLNENEMKDFFRKSNCLVFPFEENSRLPICITYSYRKEIKAISTPYYFEEKFMNRDFISSYLSDHIFTGDTDLFSLLVVNYYMNPCAQILCDIAKEVKIDGRVPKDYFSFIDRFLNGELSKKDSKGNYPQDENGKTINNFRKIVNMALILADYDKKGENFLAENILSLEERIDELNNKSYLCGTYLEQEISSQISF